MLETAPSFEARGLPSNTWMPGPTPLTTPNDTQFHTMTQQSPHWLQWVAANSPPKLPLPLRRSRAKSNTPLLIHPTHHPKQHPDPISRFATIHMCGRRHGTSECSVPWALRSMERRAIWKFEYFAHLVRKCLFTSPKLRFLIHVTPLMGGCINGTLRYEGPKSASYHYFLPIAYTLWVKKTGPL